MKESVKRLNVTRRAKKLYDGDANNLLERLCVEGEAPCKTGGGPNVGGWS